MFYDKAYRYLETREIPQRSGKRGDMKRNGHAPSLIEVSDVSPTLQVEEWPSSSITLEDQTMGRTGAWRMT